MINRINFVGRWLIATLLGALLAATLGAAPALAQSYRHTDAARDVKKYDTSKDRWVAAPKHRNLDIRRTTVRHGERRIAMHAHFRELRRKNFIIGGQFRAQHTDSDWLYFTITWDKDKPHRPYIEVGDDYPICYGRPGEQGLRLQTGYKGNVIHFSFRRTCLNGEASWIRVRFLAFQRSSKQPRDDVYHRPSGQPGRYSPKIQAATSEDASG